MAFDNPTRNRLNTFVGRARRVITDEFSQTFQSLYGIAETGALTPIADLKHLDDAGLATATLLRDRIDYLIRSQPPERDGLKIAVARLAREQAFTVLNRLAAVRMAEKRGLIIESVGHGFQSRAFQVFDRIAGTSLGDTFHRYRRFLFCLFDELSVDLGVLFDRRSPHALLFPREPALLALFELINASDIDSLWADDETIGWIYQYYNDETERKKMREESSAPRNSRELAIRNQFFTPRYVVEFLTDNTLGRIWYEMTQGDTTLKEQCRYLVRRPTEIFLKHGETAREQPKQDNLSQEDLLKQPVFIPHRSLKDPRTILMLDPACGSMHFGLYAFDLFEVIYDEAWVLEEKLGRDAPSRPPGMKSLHDTYADKDAFRRDVPRLVIEHNLHGIDIDPRCAQIAGLSLWLRAQKAWQRLGLKPAARPSIKRSNIVCAESMPGEKELLREFVEREFSAEERGICLRLLEAIFNNMQLAGEAGSLLKIEEEIRSAIEDARDAWQKLAAKPPELFTTTELNRIFTAPELTGLEQAVSSLTTGPRHLTTDFWVRIEERIYAALRNYAEQAENGGGFQRRLFAEDAAKGFAFIDVCRKHYDVLVMNPPFGEAAKGAKDYISKRFPSSKNDVYAVFVEKGLGQLQPLGLLGAITSRTGFFLSSFQKWREEVVLRNHQPTVVADLGQGVLDNAMVETAAYCIKAATGEPSYFFRLLESTSKEADLRCAIKPDGEQKELTFAVAPSAFGLLPSTPFAYWVNDKVRNIFRGHRSFKQRDFEAWAGLQSNDDFQWLRTWWEVPPDSHGRERQNTKVRSWVPYSKGGGFRTYYRDILLVVDWTADGALIKEWKREQLRLGRITANNSQCWNETKYFRAGVTWTQRTQLGLGVTNLPSGSIFGIKGPAAFVSGAGSPDILLAFMNSALFRGLVALQMAFGSYDTGVICRTPVPNISLATVQRMRQLVSGIVTREMALRLGEETEHTFVPIDPERCSLRNIYDDSLAARKAVLVFKADAQAELDELVRIAYGIEKEDAAALAETVISGTDYELSVLADEDDSTASLAGTAQEFVSALLGFTFGRWDVRYATGEQAAPTLPDPFARLPFCPPGQLQNSQALPARQEDVPASYPVAISWNGVLVDDPNHPLHIERRVREVIEIIWKDRAEGIEHEACEILGVTSLRDYFRRFTKGKIKALEVKGFFEDHLACYSKSRRQAPIYWPLSTTSGGYTLWIYYHRLTDQTLHTAIADFLKPKIKSVEQEISSLREQSKIGSQTGDLQSFRDELQELLSEIERVIRLPWKPNLNDGVLITAAPLWKLFRLGKWQKDLKTCWDELEAGDYDWAHLAFKIWPDRVREKCKKDRSLAIAHGLESICEVTAPNIKKKKAAPQKNDVAEPARIELESALQPLRASIARPTKAPKKSISGSVTTSEPHQTVVSIDPGEIMCTIRQVFAQGGTRDRETALKQISEALGYQRLGPNVRVVLDNALLTAVRRGILENENGSLKLLVGDVRLYERDFQKDNFLSALGRTWINRDDAVRAFGRWLGYARAGPVIDETARSLISGLVRENRIETDGPRLRRA